MNVQNKILDTTLSQIERRLDAIEFNQFSPQAKTRMRALILSYIRNLTIDSVRIARNHNADNVSESHVLMASSMLIAQKRHWIYDFILTVGGIVSGTGISSLYLAFRTQAPISDFLLPIVTTILGIFMIGIFIGKKV